MAMIVVQRWVKAKSEVGSFFPSYLRDWGSTRYQRATHFGALRLCFCLGKCNRYSLARYMGPLKLTWSPIFCVHFCGRWLGNWWQVHPVRLHPGRLTWNIIMEVWKIIFLSKWVICRFHVNLPGCKKNSGRFGSSVTINVNFSNIDCCSQKCVPFQTGDFLGYL